MWNLEAYNKLSIPKKLKIAYKCGKQLATRRYSGYYIELYQVDHFYTEVWFNLLSHEVFHIEGFTELKKVDQYYLSGVDVGQLLSD